MAINFFGKNAPDFGLAGKYQEIMSRPKTKEQAEAELYGDVGNILKQQKYLLSPEGMKAQLEMARADAREKAKQGLMWGTLAKLPETIAAAASPYGGPIGAAMAYQGVAAIPGIYSSTLASYPTLQIPGSSVQQYRYF
jgi:hypothetical protein